MKLAQVTNLVTFDFEISFSALPSYTCKDTFCDKRLFYCSLCISNLHSALLLRDHGFKISR